MSQKGQTPTKTTTQAGQTPENIAKDKTNIKETTTLVNTLYDTYVDKQNQLRNSITDEQMEKLDNKLREITQKTLFNLLYIVCFK